MTSLCIYCGSSAGALPEYAELARAVGSGLAERGIRLVYGGGNVGLMGILADAALATGGEVTGVIPHHLAERELAHPTATKMLHVASMHERKQTMADLADGFLVLPGGIGTLEELFETLTWLQLGLHGKPVALLNCAGFWDPLLAFLDHMVAAKFLRPEHQAMLLVGDSLEPLLAEMLAFQPPDAGKWLASVHTDLR
jgi:uncharacterized protein (TIGR00730 family)